jgi:hypothetical protein
MSYLGSPPASQFFAPGTDTFSGTGSQTAFTLSRNVATVNDILVIVNNVEQQPSNYSVSVSTLTFSTAPSSGTNNIYVRYLSTNLQTIAPQQGSVTQKSIDVGSGGVGTGAMQLPFGTTAQRPSLPATGYQRFNTSLAGVEVYNGTSWGLVSPSYLVEYLVIAGGGSGGVYTASTGYVSGNPGTASVFASITASGGGAGTAYSGSTANRNGGSGGGGGSSGGDNNTAGSGTSGQGFAGGTGQYANNVYQGGGGGGAGAAGGNASGTTAGSGGNGLSSSITGSAVTRAGGGGGGAYGGIYGGTGGSGGSGGGGAGNGNGAISGVAGTVNTGSGGGAGNTVGAGHGGGGAGGYRNSVVGELSGGNSSAEAVLSVNSGGVYTVTVGAGGAAVGSGTISGAGGSGIVIVRYSGPERASGGTITSSGGYTIHTFTSSGTFTA